jgi:hypothetical protein
MEERRVRSWPCFDCLLGETDHVPPRLVGQGLYTKCCQIAAQELGVPLDAVFTSESSTNTVPNAVPTAGSAGSDLNGYAVSGLDLTRAYQSAYVLSFERSSTPASNSTSDLSRTVRSSVLTLPLLRSRELPGETESRCLPLVCLLVVHLLVVPPLTAMTPVLCLRRSLRDARPRIRVGQPERDGQPLPLLYAGKIILP